VRKKNQKVRQEESEEAHISFRAILYVWKIYREAAGKRRYLSTLSSLYSAIMPTITAVLGGRALTQIVEAVSTKDIWSFISTIIILAIIQFAGIFLQRVVSMKNMEISQDVYTHVTEMIALKYINIPLADRESKEFADKFERVVDFGNSVNSVISGCGSIVFSAISLVAILITTFSTSPIITIVIIISSIPYSILSLKLSMKQRTNWRKHTSDYRRAYDIRQKITSSDSSLEIELNGLSRYLVDKMVRLRQQAAQSDIKDFRQYFWPSNAMRFVETVTSFVALVFVGSKIIAGQMPVGNFATIRNLLQQLSSGITSLFSGIASANDGIVNATDYMEFMNTPSPRNGEIKIDHLPKIEFRNVSFSYPRQREKALDNISFVLNPGDSLAIVGENGAGKTTLIKLLIGAYQPDDGMIFIDDEPLEMIEKESYLNQIGALFQDYSRYEFATLAENVWYGDINAKMDKKKIRSALEQAGLGTLEKKLPKGFDQLLSKTYDKENAANLSGGQWQRIGIARTFFRSPNILLLDEPTSAVDAKAEYQIFQNILESQKDRTTVIISHRFSTVRKAKKIMVLDHGRMIESGTHSELIKRGGLYKEMFELQAEGYLK
jgi:ATP-binding cassette subfamily B protein